MKIIPFFLLAALSVSSYAHSPEIRTDLYEKNWGLYSDGLDLPNAWTISKGSKKVIVAVVDTGIDSNDDFFADSFWHNPASPSSFGWDFNTHTSNPIDDNAHGTHIAGIIKAVSRNVSIMSLKYYSVQNDDRTNIKNSIEAFNYAIDHGANIINYSSEGGRFSEDEYLAIKRAQAHNILIVVASGNYQNNIDLEENHTYPASYGLPNVISVSSVDFRGYLALSSNYGINSVDVAAPGESIYSTFPRNNYGYMSGTSQATAFVTGEAVLLLGLDPKLKTNELKSIITNSVEKLPQLKDKVSSGGRVNAYLALKMLQNMLAKQSKMWNYNNTGNE